ncbi:MAG: site-specific DNA-methyltransferase [Candidatus Hermodarchaeota archaeon]
MVKLIWENKNQHNTIELKNQELKAPELSEAIISPIIINNDDNDPSNRYFIKKNDRKEIIDDQWNNLLLCGDNKKFMKWLLTKFSNKIQLIYIDPPYATGSDFSLKVQIGKNQEIISDLAYEDKWVEGLDSYLNFMHERLILMKELLSNKGSIYIHIDWHVSHYIKIMMDEIFGAENFRNEIVWAYPAASARTRRFFIRSFDTILFYSKSDDYTFNDDPKIYMEYSDRVKNALKKDDKGIFYYRGGSHDGKKLSRKVYVNQKGIFPRDVWNDIPYIRANTLEYQGFSTQKPERLLKRIILASSNFNDLIADFFCGSGTTLVVGEKLGRKWIGCDISPNNIHLTKKRMLDIKNSNDIVNWKKKFNKKCQPFLVLNFNFDKKKQIIPANFLSKRFHDNQELFSSIACDFEVNIKEDINRIIIELCNYNLHCLDVVSKTLQSKMSHFSDWIDYWAIDFNYQGDVFNSMWISYRTPKNRSLKLVSNPFQYNELGSYEIMIKVIDIFGNETLKPFKIEIK